MSALYKECYPLAITPYREESQEVHVNNNNCNTGELEDLFELLEKERLAALIEMLAGTIFKRVLAQTRKVLELEGDLELSPVTLSLILRSIVQLAENEPYGVRGGTLVVLFSPSPSSSKGSSSPVKVGTFPLDSGKVATFELHLHLTPLNNTMQKISNLARRMTGKPDKIVIDHKFSITKKKLYRSKSTTSE